jgi:membrane protein DedA with SNARE-associated domain
MELVITEFLHRLQTGQVTELPGQIYILIAVLTLFEGPLTTLAGAAAASTGLLNPALVFLSASTGNLTGDIFWHSLGRAGKLDWFLRKGRRLGFNASGEEHLLRRKDMQGSQ